MTIYPDNYYHLYNRSNNNEIVFKTDDNYWYFLQKYKKYLESEFDTIAYCLMPTHFHSLIFVRPVNFENNLNKLSEIDFVENYMLQTKKKIGRLLSSYTKAINKRFNRHGSLFQEHTKAIHVDDESYLLSLISYIHQNPVRAGLVKNLPDWEYSSYREYTGLRGEKYIKKELIHNYFSTMDEFKKHSEELLDNIREKYWVR